MSISFYPAILIVLGIGVFAGALWLAYSLGYRRAVKEYEDLLSENHAPDNGTHIVFAEEPENG